MADNNCKIELKCHSHSHHNIYSCFSSPGNAGEVFLDRVSLLPRDAMHSAAYAIARCSSVRPSVSHMPQSYPQTFLLSGRPAILVFAQLAKFRRGRSPP